MMNIVDIMADAIIRSYHAPGHTPLTLETAAEFQQKLAREQALAVWTALRDNGLRIVERREA